ncbi:MAG: hypothetical protein ACE364_11740 [Chlorobiota bacterium]
MKMNKKITTTSQFIVNLLLVIQSLAFLVCYLMFTLEPSLGYLLILYISWGLVINGLIIAAFIFSLVKGEIIFAIFISGILIGITAGLRFDDFIVMLIGQLVSAVSFFITLYAIFKVTKLNTSD